MIIGYTSGVFDLFHVGHLNILERARSQCDKLIVGVSTDELVLQYKHHLPVVGFEDRSRIVSAIKYVDQVVPQVTMDKFEAWEKLHFNRLFHGNDWKGSAMYNDIEKRLKSVNVEIIYFPYTPNVSSTMLTRRIKGQ